MIRYAITSGEPTPEELVALEDALKRHEKPFIEKIRPHGAWAAPKLRTPLPRKA